VLWSGGLGRVGELLVGGSVRVFVVFLMVGRRGVFGVVQEVGRVGGEIKWGHAEEEDDIDFQGEIGGGGCLGRCSMAVAKG
jgi:hypothetical protein